MQLRFAVAAFTVCAAGLFAHRCTAQEKKPPILRNIEEAVGVIPKAVGAREAEAPRANLAKPAWSIAPRQTVAVSVVQDMHAFSEKLDHVARICDRPPPRVLDWSISQSRIRDGLDRHGSLMWLFGQPERRTTAMPIVYALPSTDHDRLIMPLRPRYRGPVASVSMYGTTLYTRARPEHSLFAQQHAMRWLSACARSKGDFSRRLGPLNEYLARQDIGFALAREGLIDHTEIQLPFAKGTYVVPPVLRRIATESFEMSGFTAISGGVQIEPGTSLSVSIAAAIDTESDVSRWPETMTLHPKTVLAQLPKCQPALIASFASCEQWNQWFERLLERQLAVAADADPDQFTERVEFGQVRGVCVLVANEWDASEKHVDQLYHVQVHVEDADRALAGLRDCAQRLLTLCGKPAPYRIVDETKGAHQFLQLTAQGAEKFWWQNLDQPLTLSAATLNPTTLLIQLGETRQLEAVLARIQAGDRMSEQGSIPKSLDLVADQAQGLILVDPYSAALLLPRMGFGGDITATFASRFKSLESLSSIAPLIALSKDAPPLVIAAEFQPTHIVLNVTSTEELVSKLGQSLNEFVPPLQFPIAGALKTIQGAKTDALQVFFRVFFW